MEFNEKYKQSRALTVVFETHCNGFAAIYPLHFFVIPHSASQKKSLILTGSASFLMQNAA